MNEPVGSYSFPVGPQTGERKVWNGAGWCVCGLPLTSSGGQLAHHVELGELMLQPAHEPERAEEGRDEHDAVHDPRAVPGGRS
jgi:hypothetical protein